jgi:hypothetical protein
VLAVGWCMDVLDNWLKELAVCIRLTNFGIMCQTAIFIFGM